MEAKMKSNPILDFGRSLMENCPNNDCVIYRNLYRMYDGVRRDLDGCLLSEHSIFVLRHEQEKLYYEMLHMYRVNYAVRKERRNRGK